MLVVLHCRQSRTRVRRWRGRLPVVARENLLGGPPPTLLPAGPHEAVSQALQGGAALTEVAARHPAASLGWAMLAADAWDRGQAVECYAYARVGYHRGLDALRGAGWRGSGPVPWSHHPNRGFLMSLYELGRAAQRIGEHGEAQRCRQFLHDCDPDVHAILDA